MDGVIEGGSNHRSPWSIAPNLPFHVAATGNGSPVRQGVRPVTAR